MRYVLFFVFSLVTKLCEKYVKNSLFFQLNAILKFDFSKKRKQLHFSEENDLNYTHTHRPTHTPPQHTNACDNYIFPTTRANKNNQLTHHSVLNDMISPVYFTVSVEILHSPYTGDLLTSVCTVEKMNYSLSIDVIVYDLQTSAKLTNNFDLVYPNKILSDTNQKLIKTIS